MSLAYYRIPAGLAYEPDQNRPCVCRDCGERFNGPQQLHDAVAPVCRECGSEDVEELP